MRTTGKAFGMPHKPRTAVRTTSASFPSLCRAVGVPVPVPEFKFHPTRKWRIDWCWPEHRIGLEVDGGIWRNGRHTRGAGWLKDTEKLNAAAVLGFRMLRATPQQMATGEILTTLQEVFR